MTDSANTPPPSATDAVWKRDEIDSPCIKICVVHPAARICTGCYRSLDEIAGWSRYTAEERAEIRAALPERAALLRAPEMRPSRRRNARRASAEDAE